MAFDIIGAKRAGFSDTEIADELGRGHGFDTSAARSQGFSDQEIIGEILSKVGAGTGADKPAKSWGQAATEGIKNIPKSAGGVVKSIYEAVRHPVDTATNLARVGAGYVEKAIPESLLPAGRANEQYANAVTDYFKNRYGGMENLKETLASDPVGLGLDVSTLAGGGAALASKAGLGKTASVAKAVESATNPIALAARAASSKPVTKAAEAVRGRGNKAFNQVEGVLTGAGPEAITQARKGEGLSGTAFTDALRGKISGQEIAEESRAAVANMKLDRGGKYKAQYEQLVNDQTQITPANARAAFESRLQEFNQNQPVARNQKGELQLQFTNVDDTGYPIIQKIDDLLKSWEGNPQMHTPAGLDTLKRKLDSLYTENSNARVLVRDVTNQLKQDVSAVHPEYANMLKGYETATNSIKEIDRALSTSDKAMLDTNLRKLASTMREGFEFRKDLLEQLNGMTAQNDLLQKIAGYTMQQWTPKGLMGRLIASGAAYGGITQGISPAIVAMGFVSSPRAMGEFLNALGWSGNKIRMFSKEIKRIAKDNPGLIESAYQAGRTKEVAATPAEDQAQTPSVGDIAGKTKDLATRPVVRLKWVNGQVVEQ